jgi:formate dehydrogenase beta subunit
MAVPGLEIIQSSASLRGTATGLRKLPVVSKLVDTSTCIGCKACEVACQEWNDLPSTKTVQDGSYQTLPTMNAVFWNLIKFNEVEVDGQFAWLMRKDQCMHCADPGCLKACPAPGAIVQYSNGIVDVNPEQCIGCGLCETGCPFDVPRFSQQTGKMAKCTLCVDRSQVGLEPACVKACPTGCLHFGTKEDMLTYGAERVKALKADGYASAGLYDPPGVGGTGVVTVLKYADRPELYGLPRDPTVPAAVRVSKNWLRPLGLLGMGAVVLGLVGHYLRFGPRKPPSPPPNLPAA